MSHTKSNGRLLSETINEVLDRLSRLEVHILHLENRMDLMIKSNQRRNRTNDKSLTTNAQMKILKFISSNPRGSTMKELQSGTNLAKSTISVGLKNLINIGTIERIPSLRRDSRHQYILAEEIPPEIKRMMELLKVGPGG